MQITIDTPAGFSPRVHTIQIELDSAERLVVGNSRLLFEIPALAQRHFRVELEFKCPRNSDVPYSYDGLFSDGKWQGIVQANGVSEEECQTSLAEVKAALEASVQKSLKVNGA